MVISLLVLAMLATLGLALTGRVAGQRAVDPLVMTFVQLGVMVVISAAWIMLVPSMRDSAARSEFSVVAVLLAGGIGLALGNFFYLRALACGPTGLVLVVASLSILVPTAASILFFGDALTTCQIAGCAFALTAMILMNARKEEETPTAQYGWTTFALGALLLLGLYQTEGKHFQVTAPTATDQLYVAGSGLCAVIICCGLMLTTGRKLHAQELCFGAILGGLGLIQMLCILAAQRSLPVSTVYLAVLGGGPILMLIVATTLLKEKYSKQVWIGAALGILGICLMIMP